MSIFSKIGNAFKTAANAVAKAAVKTGTVIKDTADVFIKKGKEDLQRKFPFFRYQDKDE